tara:strand:+ start:497 stop:691 length:195 start_codon:yes stop_codon:yes gene_type:complete
MSIVCIDAKSAIKTDAEAIIVIRFLEINTMTTCKGIRIFLKKLIKSYLIFDHPFIALFSRRMIG